MDTMNIEILPDGSLKITTDVISPANHMTAEALLRGLPAACGGDQTRERRHTTHQAHTHTHIEEQRQTGHV